MGAIFILFKYTLPADIVIEFLRLETLFEINFEAVRLVVWMDSLGAPHFLPKLGESRHEEEGHIFKEKPQESYLDHEEEASGAEPGEDYRLSRSCLVTCSNSSAQMAVWLVEGRQKWYHGPKREQGGARC